MAHKLADIPENKWNRLNNPKEADDFGIILTESELETFEEGRQVLDEIYCSTTVFDEYMCLAHNLGRSASELLNELYLKVTHNSK